MSPIIKHIALPAIAPAAIVALYFTPLSIISCVNRGWIALAIVFVSLIAGIVLGLYAIRVRRQDPESRWWWIGSMAILMLPALLVFGPLG